MITFVNHLWRCPSNGACMVAYSAANVGTCFFSVVTLCHNILMCFYCSHQTFGKMSLTEKSKRKKVSLLNVTCPSAFAVINNCYSLLSMKSEFPPLHFKLLFSSGLLAEQTWQRMVRLPGFQGNYVPPELRGLCVTLWHQKAGWVQGVEKAFFSWSHQAGFPLRGIPLEACQTFLYIAQSVHTHTDTRCPVEYPALSFSFSVSLPCVLQSHSHCLCISSKKCTDTHLSIQKAVQYIPVGTYRFHTTVVITYVYQQESMSVTSSTPNKRIQVSEDLPVWTPEESRGM